MTSIAPRRDCPECGREIAVVSGRYARHDPPRRRRGAPLVSCPGSQTAAATTFVAPDRLGTISVFELLEGAVPGPAKGAIQDPLFPRPVVAF